MDFPYRLCLQLDLGFGLVPLLPHRKRNFHHVFFLHVKSLWCLLSIIVKPVARKAPTLPSFYTQHLTSK